MINLKIFLMCPLLILQFEYLHVSKTSLTTYEEIMNRNTNKATKTQGSATVQYIHA